MFTVTFIVSFGPKKGNLSAYAGYWYANFTNHLYSSLLFFKTNSSLPTLNWSMLHRFQFTIITSRSTTYFLFSFWCFFFFFGEILLLLMFNFSTLSDLIPSHFFISTKSHMIFWMDNSSTRLGEVIMFYIIFLTLCAFRFLTQTDLNFTYNYLRLELFADIVFVSLFIFWLNLTAFILALVTYMVTRGWFLKNNPHLL
jgi:hypothetical protein